MNSNWGGLFYETMKVYLKIQVFSFVLISFCLFAWLTSKYTEKQIAPMRFPAFTQSIPIQCHIAQNQCHCGELVLTPFRGYSGCLYSLGLTVNVLTTLLTFYHFKYFSSRLLALFCLLFNQIILLILC